MNERKKAQKIWKEASYNLRKKVCSTTYEQWFEPVVPLSIQDRHLVFGVNDPFFGDILLSNYGDLISEAVEKVTGETYSLGFEEGYELVDEEGLKETVEIAETIDSKGNTVISPIEMIGLNPLYTFEAFVVGEENRYAYTASLAAAQNPGVHNPLYIYGGTGMGKTHLLHAVCHEVRKDNPEAVIELVTCEYFLNCYVDSLKMKNHASFRNRFRNVDVLLIDDVHQLANKTQLQEEFFNTFNALYHSHKQIFMTSDKPPCEISGLEARLVSRFESGVTTEITPPGIETRLAILQSRQQNHLIKLKDDVLFFLASKITSNIRRLTGALNQLVMYSSAMSNCDVTIDLARKQLGKILNEENSVRRVNANMIQRQVAEHFDLRITDLLSSKRPKNIAVPRMIAMYLCRELTDSSTTEIGEAFGGKNHATVIHAHKKISKQIENSDMSKEISLIKSKLYA